MRTATLALLTLAIVSCSPKPCPCDPSAFKDDDETAEDKAATASGKDPCQRAADHLTKPPPAGLGCKQYGADFAEFCRAMEKQDVPMCPLKLAKAKSCEEANSVCTKRK